MTSRRRRDAYFARDLIKRALGDAGLRDFGHYPVFRAVRHVFIRSQGWPAGRPEVLALAEDALWRAISEWRAGRTFATGAARNTIAAAERDGFDLVHRAQEFIPPYEFLR